MSKRKIMSIIGMGLTVLLIVCLFLPLLSDGDYSLSWWKVLDQKDEIHLDIIILLELIGTIVVFLLQLCGVLKDSKFAYFSIGYYLTSLVDMLIASIKSETFKYLSFGFYFGLILSIATLVIVIISGFLSNDSSEDDYSNGPIRYDPNTGAPIKAQKIVGYNPNTGSPIYR